MEKINLNSIDVNDAFDYEKIHNDCLIDRQEKIEQPPLLLSIGTNYQNNNLNYNLTFLKGSISIIVAPPKSKKTFFKTIINASYIGGNSSFYFSEFKSFNRGGYVLDFDTEQDNYFSSISANRVDRMVGSESNMYKAFKLKRISIEDRLMFIDRITEDIRYKGKIDLITIDGIADLCANPNDTAESIKVISFLEKWTSKGIHICCVIHKTAGKEKGQGHLGSIIERKSDTVIGLQNTDISKFNAPIRVYSMLSRGISFNDFYFDINNEGLPQEINNNENGIL